MSNLFLLLVAACSNSVALTMLKFAGDRLRVSATVIEALKTSWWWILLGLVLYFVSFILSIKILSGSAFFRAVPIFIGFNIAFSLLISLAVFKEPLSLSATFGALLIVLGVWFIQTSSL